MSLPPDNSPVVDLCSPDMPQSMPPGLGRSRANPIVLDDGSGDDDDGFTNGVGTSHLPGSDAAGPSRLPRARARGSDLDVAVPGPSRLPGSDFTVSGPSHAAGPSRLPRARPRGSGFNVAGPSRPSDYDFSLGLGVGLGLGLKFQ
ncbi:hypothetical protein PsYK624_159840 [Phanerochaete sordida]|uniref:Uncharacterized protein n=1 Tax=Phanerochaete sordida TaxID=48140 RepID=A0A9P3GRG3_9APHY|nr:hypothetical protein PsYK624_159840 [Phanerochaete sordida]